MIIAMKLSRLKLDHVKKLFNNFVKEYKSFIESNYIVIREEDGKTGDIVARLRIKSSMPDDWGLSIGDIVHNLRSSLDLLISDLLLSNGKQPNKISAFPISESKKVFLDRGIKKIEGIDQKAIEIILKIKPYKDENLPLWQLHRLDIIDKHRIIILVVNENKAVVIDFGEHMKNLFGQDKVGNIPSMPIGIRPADRQIVDGTILFRAGKDYWTQSTQFPKFEFELVFGKGELLEGESVSKSINDYIVLVDSIIKEFEPPVSTE